MHLIFFVIRNIRVQLPKVLMLELVVFQFADYAAMQYSVIKHDVGKIVFIIYNDAFLASLKTKALAHFQQKLLQMGEQGVLQVFFRIRFFCIKSKKLKRERLPDVH